MTIVQLLALALVQGFCELLPVSSSAHVIVAEKLMGLDPTSPEMTLLLVMLHSGTMLAVIVYFWRSWQRRYFSAATSLRQFAVNVAVATACTGAVALALMLFIERIVLRNAANSEIESLFGNMYLIAAGLGAAGVLMIVSARTTPRSGESRLLGADAAWIGVIQGLCLPFRGFSRSGATISTGLLLGLAKDRAEEFSFALAVVLTPAVVVKEGHRLVGAKAHSLTGAESLFTVGWHCALGMALSFAAGLVALRWLSRWLERGRWHLFGYYCLFAALVVLGAQRFLG